MRTMYVELYSTGQNGSDLNFIWCVYTCVTLRGRIKEAARTLRKQDPTLPENRALTRCESVLHVTGCERYN